MKLVTLSSKDTYGGAARVAYRLHKYYIKQGITSLFLVNNKKSQDKTVFRAAEFYSLQGAFYNFLDRFYLWYIEKKRQNKWKPYHNKVDTIYLDSEITLLRDALDNVQYDLVHMHWVGENYVNFTEFKNIKQPIVWTLHDCYSFTGVCTHFESCEKYKTHCGNCFLLNSGVEKDFSYKTFEKKLKRYKGIDFNIVCPSNWLADKAKESALLGKYPIYVIPNGIDTDFYYPISKKEAKSVLGIDITKKTILFGGVSVDKDKRKGGHLLIQALEELRQADKTFNQQIQLLIFGAESFDFDFENIKVLGYINSEMFMRIVYSAADVVVVPSMYENLPTVIMESLSCGTPVAAFDIGGNSDMVDHKENGYLAKAYDTSDLAAGIKYCLDNNEDNRLNSNARKKVLENFKIEDVAERYIDLYKSVLKK